MVLATRVLLLLFVGLLGVITPLHAAAEDAPPSTRQPPPPPAVIKPPAPIVPPAPRVAVPQADQGLNGGWAIDDSGNLTFFNSLGSSLAIIHDAGAGWVRMVFRLGGCYPNWTSLGCNGRTALQQYDQAIASIRAQNLRVLG